MKRPVALLALALALPVLPGCGLGSSDAAPGKDNSDKRAAAMACFQQKGIGARLQGKDAITIGSGRGAPHILFHLTPGESEAASFEGNSEGAEQIGSALLYVGNGRDNQLKDVENCLASL